MRDTERERETQAEGGAGSVQGARRGTRSRVSRITPWAEGGAKPLSHPGCPGVFFKIPEEVTAGLCLLVLLVNYFGVTVCIFWSKARKSLGV